MASIAVLPPQTESVLWREKRCWQIDRRPNSDIIYRAGNFRYFFFFSIIRNDFFSSLIKLISSRAGHFRYFFIFSILNFNFLHFFSSLFGCEWAF